MSFNRAAEALLITIAFVVVTPTAANAADWTLRFDGIGPLKVGMTFNEANARLNRRLRHTPDDMRPSASCDYLETPGHPGVNLMFIDEKLARVDVSRKGAPVRGGVVIGGDERSLLPGYSRASKAPGAYDNSETEWTVHSADGGLAMRITTADHRIADAIGGESKAVAFIEACL
jgi:hypothetical protein